MCLHPKKLEKYGKYIEDNWQGKKGEEYSIESYVQCGICEECVNEKANNWLVRNNYESLRHKKICFITLTYKHNPIFLVKKDVQDFIKRFRRKLEYDLLCKLKDEITDQEELKKRYKEEKEKQKIRYFACGEYGEKKGRPHYHIIIYNWSDEKARFIGLNKKNNPLFESDIINKCWGKGRTTYQKFDQKEITYISLYSTPKEKFTSAYKMELEKAKKILKQKEDFYKKYGIWIGELPNGTYTIERKKLDKINLNEDENKKIKDVWESVNINAMSTLNKSIKNAMEKKYKYILIKEFNLWSTSIGWQEFYNQYTKNYIFTEYIGENEYATPTSWVKKLANQRAYISTEELKENTKKRLNENSLEILANLNWGIINAREEMQRRLDDAKEEMKKYSIEELQAKAINKKADKSIKEILEYSDKKEKLEDF